MPIFLCSYVAMSISTFYVHLSVYLHFVIIFDAKLGYRTGFKTQLSGPGLEKCVHRWCTMYIEFGHS